MLCIQLQRLFTFSFLYEFPQIKFLSISVFVRHKPVMTLVKVSMSAYKVTDLFCISTLNFFFKINQPF